MIRLPKGAIRQLSRLAARGGVPVTLAVTRCRAGTGWSWRACIGFKAVRSDQDSPCRRGRQHRWSRPRRGRHLGPFRRSPSVDAVSSSLTLETRSPIYSAAATPKGLAPERGSALNHQTAKAFRRAARRSDNWARQTAGQLVARYGVIVLEDLKLKNMTRSARGTLANPGRNVAAKQVLNRKLAEAALGRVRHWICVKAEEAGRRTWVVNPVNTSRTCAICGHCAVWNRRSRDLFRCVGCGHEAHADSNAAQNIAFRGAVCETTWRATGSPPLARPKPRLQRRRSSVNPSWHEPRAPQCKPGAGPALGHPAERDAKRTEIVHRSFRKPVLSPTTGASVEATEAAGKCRL